MEIGYCTNVHAGKDLATTRENLERHALRVKGQLHHDAPMGIGLWLSANASQGLLADASLDEFAGWLADSGLHPFTLNGFPYGDFHQPVVKHAVYTPDWTTSERLDFTTNLVGILDRLLPANANGSISTLPLTWGGNAVDSATLERCCQQLVELCKFLRRFEQERQRTIFVCLEPEPGCALQRTDDLVSLFERYLDKLAPPELETRRYLRVCHDICHAAVMFEDQAECFEKYREAGLQVGKVQVSSAIRIRWDRFGDSDQLGEARRQLSEFAEDRYLHQLSVVDQRNSDPLFFEDLPDALQRYGDSPAGEWRVHFHLPIYLEQFGQLETTNNQIKQCLDAARATSDVEHFEVETYAWNVLPQQLQHAELADGIAEEMRWFQSLVDSSTEHSES